VSVLLASDIHKYKLLVSYTNTMAVAHDGWKLQVFIPSFVKCTHCEFEDYDNTEVDGVSYTKFETDCNERVYPGETVKLTTKDPFPYRFIEYEITHPVYVRSRQGGEVLWKFFSPNAPPIEGNRCLSELHEF
jgi:hypothetical protein